MKTKLQMQQTLSDKFEVFLLFDCRVFVFNILNLNAKANNAAVFKKIDEASRRQAMNSIGKY